jgi:DNA-binding NarL/FixJ family response regulator
MSSVLIVDDNNLMRRMLKELVEIAPDLEVKGEAGSVEEAMSLALSRRFDIILIDISLQSREGGVELIKRFREQGLTTPILSVSLHEQSLYEEKLREAGGQGYLMKQDAVDNIVPVIHSLLEGKTYWPAAAA